MAPMTRAKCDHLGLPSKELAEFYIKKAEDGVGLIIIESCAVNPGDAMGYLNGAQFHNHLHVEAWKPIVDKIHEKGAKIWIQLFHAGRLSVKEICGMKPVSPSAVSLGNSTSFWRPLTDNKVVHFQTNTEFETPRELDINRIQEIIEEFKNSCVLAEKAGFDGVELHGAHGYLIHEFFNKKTNLRTDEYKAESLKFIKDLVSSCKRSISKNFTLSYRLSLHMVDNFYVRLSGIETDYKKLINELDMIGIDVFHCSELNAHDAMFKMNNSLLKLIVNTTKKTVIACGGIDSQNKANELLTVENINLIAFGRSILSTPNFMEVLKNDKELIKFNYENHF